MREFPHPTDRPQKESQMKYRQIVFDIDGTLIDSEQPILHSLQEVLLHLTGRKYPLEDLTFCLGITGEDTLKRLDIQDIPAAMELWFDILRQHENEMVLYGEIEELITHLKKAGYGLGIITSKPRILFEQDFGKFHISSYFHPVVCADDTKEHKPTSGPLLKYMELSGAEKEDILYIGDSVYDSKCAENAGFCTGGLGQPYEDHSRKLLLKKSHGFTVCFVKICYTYTKRIFLRGAGRRPAKNIKNMEDTRHA